MIDVRAGAARGEGSARSELLETARRMSAQRRVRVVIVADDRTAVQEVRALLVGAQPAGPQPAVQWGTSSAEVRALLEGAGESVVFVPYVPVVRPEAVAYVTLAAVARGTLAPGDDVACLLLSGVGADALLTLRPEREYPLTRSVQVDRVADPSVLLSVIDMAIAIGSVRHGRVCGTLFTVGDADRVLAVSTLYPFEPFHGYARPERNVADPRLRTTLEKFACLDGAFVIAGDGTVEALVKTIHPPAVSDQIPGLGSRHATAGGITASTQAYAVTVSESAGRVRVFKGGRQVFVARDQG